MTFLQTIIGRPILASVMSIIIFIVGALALLELPIAEYPEVVPPTVNVTATYPGANPEVLADTVAAPLEQEIVGVENMIYMSSHSTSDGILRLTITFELGTDLDIAQVQVQNRVDRALPRLPQEVQQQGVVTQKASPDMTLVVHMKSLDDRYDALYLTNYAVVNVKDELSRLPGVGEVRVFGAGEFAMRIWLNPDKLAELDLTTQDVISAIQEQNRQAAAGSIGSPPSSSDADFQMLINVKGRLTSEDEFRNIVVRVGNNGQITYLKDIARIELGAESYTMRSLLDNKPAAAMPVFQLPGANALDVADAIRTRMEELSSNFPEGIDYEVIYDPTIFVRSSIDAVIHTLFEAIALVVIVVVLFLQSWRASIIPLIAVPVSLVGTFALMHVFGFSLNNLTLFGLVLAIGIVVDDAIVVVENVERHIELGETPLEASRKAMKEVTGPIIATSLVLCAVFIPTAFISGLSGMFYKQFALTIAISTIISTFNSLTLSPALAGVLLKSPEQGGDKDLLSRLLNGLFGWWLFRPFNWLFEKLGIFYRGTARRLIRFSALVLLFYGAMIALGGHLFQTVPGGFVPVQDKALLIAFTQLPDGATLDRTEEVVREMTDIALDTPGVIHVTAFPGLSINGFTNTTNAGTMFINLASYEERSTPELYGMNIMQELNRKMQSIKGAIVRVVPYPSVRGIGTMGGFKLQIEDRSALGLEALFTATQEVMQKAAQDPALDSVFSSFQIKVPQLNITVDREKAKIHGVSIEEIFQSLQVYMGSMYVNDFNRFGRTYMVYVQAEKEFRDNAEQIYKLKVRNGEGEMIPMGSFINIEYTAGPERVMRYNAFPTAELNGQAAPGYSTGQAQAAITRILDETLPRGMTFEWTDLVYQEQVAGNTMIYVFPLVVLMVFLVLAGQYESWSLPMAIILIVPMTIVSAMLGVLLHNSDNNIFTQIGLVVLVGLASKNAILIVEFAKDKEDEGLPLLDAVLEASLLRLRPILMTSMAFILGVLPLVLSTGAGAEMREALGIAVFWGMLGVTLFGLLMTPVFYYLVRRYLAKDKPARLSSDQPSLPQ